jgi:hypothetical protein
MRNSIADGRSEILLTTDTSNDPHFLKQKMAAFESYIKNPVSKLKKALKVE